MNATKTMIFFALSLCILVAGIASISAIEIDSSLSQLSDDETASVIVKFSDSSQYDLMSADDSSSIGNYNVTYVSQSSPAATMEITKADLESLSTRSDIISIIPSPKFTLLDTQSNALIGANNAAAIQVNGVNLTGAGKTVCFIDSGIDYTHPDLGACTQQQVLGGTCNKVLGGYAYYGNTSANLNDPMDDTGHGTHVAGITAANGAMKGVAPQAKIVAMKVCDSSLDCNTLAIIDGIRGCLNAPAAWNISVISMSVGSGVHGTKAECDALDPAFTEAFAEATRRNIQLVAAAGNSGGNTGLAFPACASNVTAVGATTKDDLMATFSDTKAGMLSIVAPGQAIDSTLRVSQGGYGSMSGTSMAAPHVSGSVLLLQQLLELRGQTRTPAQIASILNNTGTPITDTDGATYRRINADQAIFALLNSTNNLSPQADGDFVLSFVSPTPGQIFKQNNLETTAASDVTIDEMHINLDGSAYINPCNDCNGFTVPVTNLLDGPHTLDLVGVQGTATKNLTVRFYSDADNSDNTAPTVSSTTPASSGTNFAVGANIQANFNEAMDGPTLNSNTFTVMQGSTPVAGAITYSGNTATFNPTNDLQAGTTYTATISTGAKDFSGNSIATQHSWTFTTASEAVENGPYAGYSVIFTEPSENEVYTQNNFIAAVTANETIDTMYINLDGSAYIVGCTTCSSFTVPVNNLADGSHNLNVIGVWGPYNVSRTVNFVVDTDGSGEQDTTAPTISSVTPANSATSVAVGTNIVVQFNEAMDANTINSNTFTVMQGSTPVAGAITYSGNTATFNPTNDLSANTVYTVQVTTGAEDVAGNALASGYTGTFTTAEEEVTPSGPYAGYEIEFIEPSANEIYTDNEFTAQVSANETLDSMWINLDGGSYIEGCVNCNGFTVPVNNLQEGQHSLNVIGVWGSFNESATVTFFVNTTVVEPPVNDTNSTENNNTEVPVIGSIELIAPINGYTTIANESEVEFAFNIDSESNVGACELQLNAEEYAHSVSNQNSTQIISRTVAAGNYSWNVNCMDEHDRQINSSTRTFSIIAPSLPVEDNETEQNETVGNESITLLTPINGSVESGSTVNIPFTFSIDSTEAISTCSIYASNGIVLNLTVTNQAATQNAVQAFNSGNYTWYVQCSNGSIMLNSTVNSFSIINSTTPAPEPANETAEQPRRSGGGGGGSSSVTSVSASQIDDGYSKTMRAREQISFVIPETNKRVSLVLNAFTNQYANLTVAGQRFTLEPGQSMRLNVSSSTDYDVLVTLEGLNNSRANITITAIDVPMSMPLIEVNANSQTEADAGNDDDNQEVEETTTITGNVVNEDNDGEETGIAKAWNALKSVWTNMFRDIRGWFGGN